MKLYRRPSVSHKNIFSKETLFQVARDLRRQGVQVGLTHGAFDLFHISHLCLLQESARMCDYFIVGIDSDENVAKYKSYKRPINGEKERMEIISEVKGVDAVFLNDTGFSASEYRKLYVDLGVDLITIGRGFNFVDEVKEEAIEIGASLISIDTPQYPSTSAIVESIIKKYRDVPAD
ncbi:adenylyltransferase/cytidyltransferase family protein [Candidatus Dojkabacteria bacterium]|nr:adenylyltransferase/cytidyltransferase family protein [Candidatus Dojkabacteria bacterium]